MTHRPLRPALAGLLALLSPACGSNGGARDGAPADTSGYPEDAAPGPDAGSGIDGPVTFSAWPSDGTVVVACRKDQFDKNLSGLAYQPAAADQAAVLWAVQNEPPKLYRLTWDGAAFVPVTTDAWVTGKLLRYPNASGSPDTEGLTLTDGTSLEVYVVAERNGDKADVSRQSILRYELGSTKGILDATHEWVLTADLPTAEANHGLEGIAWIPDTYLVERGFFDEHTQARYDPASYPDHGAGIFLVGRDDTGMVYGYALDHKAGGFVRLATFSSGLPRSVDLSFDRDTGTVWSLGGRDCGGVMTLLDIDVDADPPSATRGRFTLRATVPPPKALSDMNNEGIALAPFSECNANRRAFFWADDGASGGYAIRKGSMTCGRLY